MSTDVEIANIALARLSMEPIVSLTENSDRAKKVRPVFPLVFNRFLTEYGWSFATEQTFLNLLPAPRVPAPYRNAFALPVDFVKLQAFFPNGTCHSDPADIPYRVQRRTLYTNADSVEIRYTSSKTLLGDFSPAAADALACLLAVELTLNIKNSTDRAELLLQRYQAALKAAIRDDIKSTSPEKMGGHDYSASRFLWGRF